MPFYYLCILALVQGITEFLPISSSGHLILLPSLLGEDDQGLALDVAVHVGTLLAVMLYFRKDIFGIIRAYTFDLRKTEAQHTFNRKLGFYILLGSIPVIIAGFIMHMLLPEGLRDPRIIIATTLIFGLALWVADRKQGERPLNTLNWRHALIIGCAQILALIPGTSRSGITITAALFLGFTRTEAARFSMLLGIPAIAGAGTLSTIDIINSGDTILQTDALISGALSFITAYAAIFIMMRWLKSSTFTPFVIYRMILGGVLLFVFLL